MLAISIMTAPATAVIEPRPGNRIINTGAKVTIDTTSGLSFADDLSGYKMIIHCGACMLNDREVMYRAKCAEDAGIPMTNYGIAIAHMHGILRRSLGVFPDILSELDR